MAIYQPSQITPDVRSGIGLGVVDATAGMTVSWRINGPSALTAFQITIYLNNANSTQKYTTGKITTGCPAYGTSSSGAIQLFSYTIAAATLSGAGISNGNEYKLVIQQWWSNNDSVTQSSASVFVTRKDPTLTISTIGSGGVISTRYYTFTGNYSQAQGDALNWFRWQIAYQNDTNNPFFDSERITGTMDISAYYDGFFAGSAYAVRLTCQTENGVEKDTGWVNFSCSYAVPATTGGVYATCAPSTDAVLVEWSGIGAFPGTATGYYSISPDHILTLGSGGTITWEDGIAKPMNLAAPWSILWKGTLGNQSATLFTIAQTGVNVTLSYDFSTQSLVLKKGSTTLATQTGIINAPTVTAILTEDTLYLRVARQGGGLYPAATLYPSATLYPKSDNTVAVSTYTISVTYTQSAITMAQIGGYQICHYFEIQSGTVSADTIIAAITNGTYVPALAEEDYMLVNWTNGINAGSLDVGGDTIIGFAIYRGAEGSAVLEKIGSTDANTEAIFDYGATSQSGPYTYYLFPIGQNTYIASPIISGQITPCWWNWTLMECEETDDENIFSVLAAYRFRYNVTSGAISNSNAPSVLPNFTQYPTVQLAPQNYKSGVVSGLIGVVDWTGGQPQYIDSIALRDAIFSLSVTTNPLFLKNRKGDLIRVKINGGVTAETVDNTQEQMQIASIPWIEVGSAKGVSLFAMQNKGVAP